MSYSDCFKCSQMVSSYQKYCEDCAKEYRQDNDYWSRAIPKISFKESELEKDRKNIGFASNVNSKADTRPIFSPSPVITLNRHERRKLASLERRKK